MQRTDGEIDESRCRFHCRCASPSGHRRQPQQALHPGCTANLDGEMCTDRYWNLYTPLLRTVSIINASSVPCPSAGEQQGGNHWGIGHLWACPPAGQRLGQASHSNGRKGTRSSGPWGFLVPVPCRKQAMSILFGFHWALLEFALSYGRWNGQII